MTNGFKAGPMAAAKKTEGKKDKGFNKGPMQPAEEYKRTGRYPRATVRREKKQVVDDPAPAPTPKVTPLPPPTETTSPYVQGAERKRVPVETRKPERRPEFYEKRTEKVPLISGRGIQKSEFVGMIERADVEDNQRIIQEVQELPDETRFIEKRDDSGVVTYEAVIPESVVLERPIRELKRFESYPPIIKEISRTGYFLTQGMFAVAKPVFQLTGKGNEFDIATGIGTGISMAPFQPEKQVKYSLEAVEKSKYGVHYPSLMDPIFEPIGWSPKGSTEILKKHPVEAAVGGLGAEFAQGVAIGGAIGKVGKSVVSPGTKALVRGGAKAAYRFTRVFPEEKIVSKGIQTVGRTPFAKNIYLWATKGYKPIQRLTSAGAVKTAEKFIEGDVATTRVISRRLIEGGGRRLERVFVSPDEAARATMELGKKMGTRMSITFPKTPDVAQSYLHATKMKGLLSKRLVTTEKAFYTTWNKQLVGTSQGFARKGLVFGVRERPGFFRAGPTEIIKEVDDVTRMSYTTRFNPYEARYRIDDIYDVGNVGYEQTKMIGGVYEKRLVQPVSAIRGTRATKAGFFTGPSTDDPLVAWAKQAEKARTQWVARQRWKHPVKTFISDVKATQRVVPSIDVSVLQKPVKTAGMGRLGIVRRLQAPAFPSRIPTVPLATVGYIEAKGAYKFLRPERMQLQKKLLSYKLLTKQEEGFERVPMMKREAISIQRREQNRVPVTAQETRLIVSPVSELEQKQIQKQLLIIPARTYAMGSLRPVSGKPGKIRSMPFKLNELEEKRKKRKRKQYVDFDELYRYREKSIIDPFSDQLSKLFSGGIGF